MTIASRFLYYAESFQLAVIIRLIRLLTALCSEAGRSKWLGLRMAKCGRPSPFQLVCLCYATFLSVVVAVLRFTGRFPELCRAVALMATVCYGIGGPHRSVWICH